MSRYKTFFEKSGRPSNRRLLVGGHIIVFLLAIYIIDLRIEAIEATTETPQSATLQTSENVAQKIYGKRANRKSTYRPYRPKNVRESIRPWLEYVHKYSRQYGVDPDLVSAVLYVESCGDPYSVSPRGALGLMQLTPPTAEYLGVSDALDPEQNIRGGVKYLAWLIARYDETSALLAYNAGMGTLERNHIPAETRQFLERVITIRSFLKDREKTNDLS